MWLCVYVYYVVVQYVMFLTLLIISIQATRPTGNGNEVVCVCALYKPRPIQNVYVTNLIMIYI